MWFEQQPCGPDWGDEAPFGFRNVIEVPCRPEVLFDALVGTEAWPQFFPDILQVRWITDPPRGVGSLRHVVLKTQQVHEHFTVYEPGVRWAFYVSRSTLPLVTHFMEDYRFSPTPDGGTRLEWLVHYRPRTLLRPLRPVLGPVFARMFRRGAENLRAWAPDNL